jgi:hypothetical protein
VILQRRDVVLEVVPTRAVVTQIGVRPIGEEAAVSEVDVDTEGQAQVVLGRDRACGRSTQGHRFVCQCVTSKAREDGRAGTTHCPNRRKIVWVGAASSGIPRRLRGGKQLKTTCAAPAATADVRRPLSVAALSADYPWRCCLRQTILLRRRCPAASSDAGFVGPVDGDSSVPAVGRPRTADGALCR